MDSLSIDYLNYSLSKDRFTDLLYKRERNLLRGEMRKLIFCLCLWLRCVINFVTFIPRYFCRLQDEKGKREIAENVAVNKARELEVQKRTSVMVLGSLSQNICQDFSSLAQNSLETMDYASKVCCLFVCLFVCLFICLSISLSVCLFTSQQTIS